MQIEQKSKKWLWAGLLVAFLNPIFSGFILGVLFSSEPSLKKEGKIILWFSVLWGALTIALIGSLQSSGVLPTL